MSSIAARTRVERSLAPVTRRTTFAAQLGALVWKEVLVEARGRETVLAGAVFALLVLVIFNFAFDLRVESVAAVAPGVLWVTVTFAGVLALGRAFARESVLEPGEKWYPVMRWEIRHDRDAVAAEKPALVDLRP